MSNHPGPKETLETLDALNAAVRDFTGRETELARQFSTEQNALRRQHQKTLEAHESRLAQEISQAESSFQLRQEKTASTHQTRHSKIASAQKSARQQRLKEIDARESRVKFTVQRDSLQTSRQREAAQKTTESNFEAFRHELDQELERLEQLEHRAHRLFRGFKKFRNLLAAPPDVAAPDSARPETELLRDLRSTLDQSARRLDRFRWSPLPFLFRWFPLWLLIPLAVLIHLGALPLLDRFQIPFSPREAVRSLMLSLAGIVILYFAGRLLSAPAARRIAALLGQARALHDACDHLSATRHDQELHRLNHEAEDRLTSLDRHWHDAVALAAQSRESWAVKLDEKAARCSAKNDALLRSKREKLEQEQHSQLAQIKEQAASRQRELDKTHTEHEQRLAAAYDPQWRALAADWQNRLQPLYDFARNANSAAGQLFPDWDSSRLQKWSPPPHFAHAAKFARIEVDVAKLAGGIPQDPRLALPGPGSFSLPLLLTFPNQGSVLFETGQEGRDEVAQALNNIIFRLLSVAPPGRLNFTIFDPVELGQNFAGLMHLADYESRLINDRIWTQTAQIEERLADINAHIEKVTQMYLRNEYETIAEYNRQAGRIAEKYQFLVIADFPAHFSDLAVRRLLSIAAGGPRCGVYLLLHWNRQLPLPHEFAPEQLRSNALSIRRERDRFILEDKPRAGAGLILDPPPDSETATAFLHQVGQSSIDSNRVEMPFADIAPPEPKLWSLDAAQELRVPIGRTGATKLQYLALGKGTRQHALIAGKTGSGKSTLFHVLITNLALWSDPDQVEFYLVDFKKGVEFKCYAVNRLPHARVVAIESDREFGLSVLQRVDDELKRRGDLFRKLGAQDLASYKRAGGTESLPRTLLIVDEFQEFFVQDDRVSQNAALLLDRIVRQGRAFGVHVLLGSQTLGGAYTLARATLGQMVVRIALQCNEADAYLIMDDENPAPRLLSRPGEAIYNDAAGAIQGNSPFQVVWLSDDERDARLAQVRRLADAAPTPRPGPIVFEGNAPADVAGNHLLERLLEADSIHQPRSPLVWLGAPNSIKGPTEVSFKRQSGNNLLVIGQREEAILALFGLSLIALAAQHPRGTARFILFDSSPPGSPERRFLERLAGSIPHDISLPANADIDSLMDGLAEELETRSEPDQASASPAVYLFIHGLQRLKKLRYEEDFEFSIDDSKPAPPGNKLNQIICEGAGRGFHLICACDTANNLSRGLSRKAISEFELRLLFQMSAQDSAILIDNPDASNLGLHRAIFSNAHEGYMETFRPYALPDDEWLDQALHNLSRLLSPEPANRLPAR